MMENYFVKSERVNVKGYHVCNKDENSLVWKTYSDLNITNFVTYRSHKGTMVLYCNRFGQFSDPMAQSWHC